MRISQLTVRNFRSLVDIDLPLHPLTVVIGPNGSGKTTLMEVLLFLRHAGTGDLKGFFEARGGYQAVLSQVNDRQTVANMTITVQAIKPDRRASNSEHTYVIETESNALGYTIADESLRTRGSSDDSKIVFEYEEGKSVKGPNIMGDRRGVLGPSEIRATESILTQIQLNKGNKLYNEIPVLRRLLINIKFHTPLDVSARSPVRLPQTLTPAVTPGDNGENLYSALYNLRANHSEIYDQTLGILMQAMPGLHRLEFPVVGAGQVTLAWHDRNTRQPFYPNQLSEGTLRFLWLLVLLKTAESPVTLLIDEPELSLHPELLRLLAILLQEAALENQIVVATHSSELISWLRPEEVLIADKEDGQTRFTWADTLNLEKWLAEYTLRDLWLMGNLGGRP